MWRLQTLRLRSISSLYSTFLNSNNKRLQFDKTKSQTNRKNPLQRHKRPGLLDSYLNFPVLRWISQKASQWLLLYAKRGAFLNRYQYRRPTRKFKS